MLIHVLMAAHALITTMQPVHVIDVTALMVIRVLIVKHVNIEYLI